MELLPVIVPLLVVVLVCVGLLRWWFSEAQRTKRALRSAPLRTIASLQGGENARIRGRVRYLGEAPLAAPFSERPCAVYDAEATMSSGRTSKIVRDRDARNFLVDDGTGIALVNVSGFELALRCDHRASSGVFEDPPPHVLTWLQARGEWTEVLGMNRSVSYTEGIIEADEVVTVLGRMELERVAGSHWRVTALSPEGGLLRISDDPRVA